MEPLVNMNPLAKRIQRVDSGKFYEHYDESLANMNPLAKRIYQRLLDLVDSGKFYEYYDEHLCNMDCFHKFKEFLETSGKREEYNQIFLDIFRSEITLVLEKCNGKLRPIINPHVECHIQPDKRDVNFALSSVCKVTRIKFNATFQYLQSQNIRAKYVDVDGAIIFERKELESFNSTLKLDLSKAPNGHVVKDNSNNLIFMYADSKNNIESHPLKNLYYYSYENKKMSIILDAYPPDDKVKRRIKLILDVDIDESVSSANDERICGSVFTTNYVTFYNALEVLDIHEQVDFLCATVENSLKDYYLTSIAEMLIEPNNLCHGEVVLFAQAALSVYGEKELQQCVAFFRQQDIETTSDFKMGL